MEINLMEILEHPATWRKFDDFVDEVNNVLDAFETRQKVVQQCREQFAIRQSFN